MAYTCKCTPRTLFNYGCTCGAFANEKRDREIIAKREADEARARLAEDAVLLTGPMPTPPVLMANDCDECGHPAGNHVIMNWLTHRPTACNTLGCSCQLFKGKPLTP